MEEKPTAAFVLSLIGGIFILLGGIWLAIVGAIIAIFTAGAGAILGIFAISGIIIIIGSAMMYNQATSAKTWGIIILILGIISLIGIVTAVGGILSIIGGILAIVWKPSAPATSPPPPP
jgi:hypothetical protein